MKYNKIKNKRLIGAFILMFVILAGCEVTDLEESPKSFIAPNNFFQTAEQIQSVFPACMRRTYRPWQGYAYNPSLFKFTDQDAGGNLIIPLNHGADIYEIHYANIKDLNFAIASIVNGNLNEASAADIDLLMGQLKFLRAWNYFQLVRMWGPVPLLTEENTNEYFGYLPERSSIVDVYGLIVNDFLEAIEKLPVDWGTLVGRPAKDAAKSLLAKVYLTMATAPLNDASYYSKAAALAKEVISAGNYSLVHDINNVFSMGTEYGPEIMWSFEGNTANPSTNPKIWSGIYGWADYSADRYWVDSVYVEQPRKHVYIETYNREGVHFSELGRKPGIKKFLYDTWDNFSRGFTTINIPIIRYADVLLIFAEAENMSKGGPTQEAVDAVNAVINRANNYEENPNYPLLTTSMLKEKFDEAVIFERNLELCFENDRWFDLIRKRILQEKTRIEYRPNFSEHIYLFPIPESEVRLNENIKQNPGYN